MWRAGYLQSDLFSKMGFTPVGVAALGIAVMFVLALLSQMVALALTPALFAVSPQEALLEGEPTNVAAFAASQQFMIGFSQLFGYALAGWLMVFGLRNKHAELGLQLPGHASQWPLAAILAVAIIPLVFAVTFDKESFNLPEWLSGFEQVSHEIEQDALKSYQYIFEGSLLVNILVLAVLPGLCEELFFRGFLLQSLVRRLNPHVAIWVVALLFSFFHFQFYGFFTRLLLGALFGYLRYWSGSLWPAVVAHAAYNAANIILAVAAGSATAETDLPLPWWLVAISVVFTVLAALVYRSQGRRPFVRLEPQELNFPSV